MDEITARQARFLKDHRRHHHLVTALRFLIFFLFLAAWEISTRVHLIDAFIFSSPSRILETVFTMGRDGSIFRHTGITLYETLVSFLLVILVSFLMATVLWFSSTASEVLEPCLVILNSLPKSALAPLLIVWLGANPGTIIVAGMSVAVFGSIISMYTAFRETDEEKIKLIRTLGGNRMHILCCVVFPSSIPSILSILKVNIGLCLVGVIIGEFLAAREGLGYLIIYASQIFKMNYLITSLIILCIIAFLLYQIIQKLEHYIRKARKI
ncbi:MAG TPA: sulfonate ABC transporter permease [Lachnospiraceae bacterium]|nr:sulfonate ABC transporter permease [Lachnospiraceae bacterium]